MVGGRGGGRLEERGGEKYGLFNHESHVLVSLDPERGLQGTI